MFKFENKRTCRNLKREMRIFCVTSVDDNDEHKQLGAKNEVQLNAYNLLVQDNTISCNDQESRKISFAQLTRYVVLTLLTHFLTNFPPI